MLNEVKTDQRSVMGLASKPGVDIRGLKRPSHEGQVSQGVFQRQRDDVFITSVTVPNFRPSKSNMPSASNPMVADAALRGVHNHREPQDQRERAQCLVREYTEGAIKKDAFSKGLCQLGIDARPGSEIAKLQQRLEDGDERVGFRMFNKAIAVQFV